MILQKQQQAAYEAILSFLNDPSKNIFILKGYAGTGKTTLVASLVEYLTAHLSRFYLLAPTGKAAKVLTDKTGREATTIHRGIYQSAEFEIVNADNVEESEVIYKFPIRVDDTLNKICIIDEASMVSSIDSQDVVFRFGSGNIMNDLLEFADTYHGGKLIFIGDPAQLPPVGDRNSESLREEYFTSKGYTVDSYELTDVLRQDKDSLILQNALKVREILRLHTTNSIDFNTNDTEFAETGKDELLRMYCSDLNGIEKGESVLLTYSNAEAAQFNKFIRSELIGKEELQKGEILMVVNNNYRLSAIDGLLNGLMNGNMVRTLDVSHDVEVIHSFANIHEGGQRKRIPVNLTFRNVTIADSDNNVYECKLLDSLLSSSEPSMSYLERQALFINFRQRHPQLKPGTLEFVEGWKKDPYANAIQAKYGYAITVHKSQGSEWSRVYLNYRNANTSEECLRWIYTATTRASNAVLAYNVPHITPTSHINIASVTALSHKPEGWGQKKTSSTQSSVDRFDVTPFHSADANEALRRKYWQTAAALEGTPFHIDDVQQKPYREIYMISGERFDTCYSGRFIFRDFTAVGSSSTAAAILKLLNGSASEVSSLNTSNVEEEYNPSTYDFQMIWNTIKPILSESDVKVDSVVENKEQYYVQYNLHTSGQFAFLKVYFNDKHFITYVAPGSNIGAADEKLNNVLELLKDC